MCSLLCGSQSHRTSCAHVREREGERGKGREGRKGEGGGRNNGGREGRGGRGGGREGEVKGTFEEGKSPEVRKKGGQNERTRCGRGQSPRNLKEIVYMEPSPEQ